MNDHGLSEASSILEVIAANSPATMLAPFKVTADTTMIEIGWTAPTDDGFNAVLGYKVYWNAGGSGNIIETPIYDTMSDSILSFTISAPQIVGGSTYSFAVSAYNAVSSSGISNIVQIIAAEVPDKPVSV